MDTAYSLGDLIDAESLARMRAVFSRLCRCEIALCDGTGQRIDDGAVNEGKSVEATRDCKAQAAMSDTRTGEAAAASQRCPVCDVARWHSVPVRWNEQLLGRVVVLEERPDEATREFAELIADVLAQLAARQARIRRRVRELTAVYDLSGLFARSADLSELLNEAARRVCEVMDAKAVGIRLLDEATGELHICGVYNLSQDYLNKGQIKYNSSEIDAAAFRGEVVYIEDARKDPRILFPEHAKKEGLVSGLCAPMSYRGQVVGVLRVYSDHVKRFSDFDIELLRAAASQAAGAVVNSRLFAEQMDAEQHRRHYAHAAEVQRRMIPAEPPRHPKLAFGHVYEPSLELGGDFFDFIDLAKGNVGLAIADVVGKGMPGALMMASVRSALRAHAHSIFDINEIVAHVNRMMCRDTLDSEFATLCYGVFSPDGSRFTYCNAGHNPPLLLRGEAFTALEVGGPLIGVLPDATFERQVIDLHSGDHLVFYTDGVTEALDFAGEAYGVSRLKESILRHRALEVGPMVNQLMWDVRRFAGLAEQSDDITLVLARVR